MKKSYKTIIAIIISLSILMYGQTVQALSFGTIKSEGDDFISRGEGGSVLSISEVQDELFPVGGIMLGIATAVFIVVGLIMGVKYMIAGADEKAKLKEKLIWYVIAVIIAYGAVGLYNLAVTIMQVVLG